MKFRNPQNNYVEEFKTPRIWAFLLGPVYFLFNGLFGLTVISLFVGLLLLAIHPGLALIVWVFYAFSIKNALRKKYGRKGWEEIEEIKS